MTKTREELHEEFGNAAQGCLMEDVIHVSFDFFMQVFKLQWDKLSLEEQAEKVKRAFMSYSTLLEHKKNIDALAKESKERNEDNGFLKNDIESLTIH